jgi:hypothetical protein
MIAYNKVWLANLRLQAELKKDKLKGFISDAEFKVIAEKYPVGFYTPGLFARIGLFILTCVVISFGDGLLTLFFAASDLSFTFGWMFFMGMLIYIALEFMVKTRHHHRSGIDDALLFISGLLFAVGFTILFSHYNNVYYLPLSGAIFILNLYFTIRFADMFMTALCCFAFLAFVFFGWTKNISFGTATIPFIMMLVSGVLYGLSYVYNKQKKFADYQNCFIIIQVIFLLVLYLAGNYYVVQTLSDEISSQPGRAIPFGAFFWIWTMALPFVYVGFGIRKKDVILLRTGLLLIAAAVITFRTYYHVLPLDTALTIGGALILGIAYAIMKYLKTPKHGFTYAEPDDTNFMDHLKVESLIVAETFAKAPAAPANDHIRFGGGDAGGGGSSGSF